MVSVDGREHSARTAETSRRMSTVGAYGLRCRVDGSLRNYNERSESGATGTAGEASLHTESLTC